MKLIDNWRAELNRLWVIKTATAIAWLGLLEQVLPTLQSVIPPVVYAILALVCILVRLRQQKPPPPPAPFDADATAPGRP